VQTFIIRLEKELSVSDFTILLSEKTKIAINNPSIKLQLESEPIPPATLFSELFK
jgi:hypothetical protein